jgi:hypothetical protein
MIGEIEASERSEGMGSGQDACDGTEDLEVYVIMKSLRGDGASADCAGRGDDEDYHRYLRCRNFDWRMTC